MTFQELEAAIKGGWTVAYKVIGNQVITEDKYSFSFPYSGLAVKSVNGALSYIAQYEGTDDDFFIVPGG